MEKMYKVTIVKDCKPLDFCSVCITLDEAKILEECLKENVYLQVEPLDAPMQAFAELLEGFATLQTEVKKEDAGNDKV